MGSLERRLERLEACAEALEGYRTPRRVERYMHALAHALENFRRRSKGLEALPDLPYTEEDYEDDLKTLHEHIPAMRAEPGWQTEKARTFLDRWERNVNRRVERNQA